MWTVRRAGRWVLALAAALTLAAAGHACLGPSVGEGQLACGTNALCPPGFQCGHDGRCYRTPPGEVCGDGRVGVGETCDPPASCPQGCEDGNACTADVREGDAASCTAACVRTFIEGCVDGDGCCPAACGHATDADCSASCGNDALDPGETCDPPGSCPTSCDDGNACTIDSSTGSAANCNLACLRTPVMSCGPGDGCCPVGCTADEDADCSATCGNGTLEPGETCDPPEACPASCDDGSACTVDSSTGSAANCNRACSSTAIVSCAGGDGCCPSGCTSDVDADCSATCGDRVVDVESGETCDPPETCPASCDDNVACTLDSTTGAAATCNATCQHTSIVSCASGDGCCPPGCSGSADLDCWTSACLCGACDGCCPAASAGCIGDPDCSTCGGGKLPLPPNLCGNRCCEPCSGETYVNCPVDCPSVEIECGDGLCFDLECFGASYCAEDCFDFCGP